jgi:hypothetical protein
MTPTRRSAITSSQLEDTAWRFLASEYAGPIYVDWPIDRRLDAYLIRHGPATILADGSAYENLLDKVMSNASAAVRDGVLPPPDISGA